MKPKHRHLAIAAVLLVPAIAAAFLLLGRSGPSAQGLLQPDDEAVVAQGSRLYGQHCASCHGARLEGQPDWRQRGLDGLLPAPPHDASGHTWHHASAHLIELTRFGPQRFAGPDYRSAMPAYEGTLSVAEIAAVLSFIKSTWPPEVRRRHDAIDAQAAGG